ncbi:MAG: class E sortase [Actinomycetia bacterium]|nr:class E sortase [Actinomycetes bacterium]
MSDTVQRDLPQTRTPTPKRSVFTRIVRVIGWTSIGLGLFLLGFLFHQLFVTTFFAQRANVALEAEAVEYFQEAEITQVAYTPSISVNPPEPGTSVDLGGPTGPEQVAGGPDEPKFLFVEGQPSRGQPFAIITIPKIDSLKDGWTIVEGVARSQLKTGAGHYPTTPLPGQPGNSSIAGHRTTYGAPFYDLDVLDAGDTIEVETALGVSIYEVRETVIVRPTEIWVTQDRPGAWLTLTTCNPRFSSSQRLVVFAEMVSGPNYETIYG